MKPQSVLLTLGTSFSFLMGRAQAPVVTSLVPLANARSVGRTSPITATFSQALSSSAVSGLKVYAPQRGGLRTQGATPVLVSANSLSFTPGSAFMPGEQVSLSLTKAVASASGPLASPLVRQFTVATGGTGQGTFLTGPMMTPESPSRGTAVGDVDGDGDLDVALAQGTLGGVRLLLNGGNAAGSGTGVFSSGPLVAVGGSPQAVALADVDGDGDLDLLATNYESSATTVSVRLNGLNASGTNQGTFGGGQEVAVGQQPYGLALGDVDGDGDLDLVVSNSSGRSVSIRLNGGDASGSMTGLFSAGETLALPIPSTPTGIALGDVDNDNDLDLLVTDGYNGTVRVYPNQGYAGSPGSSQFGSPTVLALGNSPVDVVLGDIDGDNDLDIAVSTLTNSWVGLFFNGSGAGGSMGTFGTPTVLTSVSTPTRIALTDVDADGDLDLLVANTGFTTLGVYLNGGNNLGGGTGTFVSLADKALPTPPYGLAVGDFDNDGDVDVVTSSNGGSRPSSVFNGGTGVLATQPSTLPSALRIFPNPTAGLPHVEVSGSPTAEQVVLLDALGRVLQTVPLQAQTATLDVAGLSPGLYVIRVGLQIGRLLVE